MWFEQEAAQDAQAPSLQPSDLSDTGNSADQTAVPQHVDRPWQQEWDKQQGSQSDNDGANNGD